MDNYFTTLLILCSLLPPLAFAKGMDPTAPLGWQKAKTVSSSTSKSQSKQHIPYLQLIVCGSANCQATLDFITVVKGDRIKGFLVRDIDENQVILEKGKKTHQLKLFPEFTK